MTIQRLKPDYLQIYSSVQLNSVIMYELVLKIVTYKKD